MSKLHYIICLSVLMLLLAGCKKDNVPLVLSTIVTNNPVGETYGGTTAIPASAAGAFYAVNSIVTDTSHTTTGGALFAWFGNNLLTMKAGVVTCIIDTLSTQVPSSSSTYPWYEGLTASLPDVLTWSVAGSDSVAGFNYTDNTSFPKIVGSVQNVSVSAPLVINYTTENAYDVLVFTISGSRGVLQQTATSGSSITFSASQMSSVTVAGDTHFAYQVMAIKTTAAGIGGLTYYFVKQSAIKAFVAPGN